MKKGNRREEIKLKEDLQRKMQYVISQKQEVVKSWLLPRKSNSNDTDPNEDGFFNLPVIQAGSGLGQLNASEFKIKDYVNADSKPPKVLSKSSNQKGASGNAVEALSRKIRKENNSVKARSIQVPSKKVSKNFFSKKGIETQPKDDSSESDEDVSKFDRKSKKVNNFLFNIKTKKK